MVKVSSIHHKQTRFFRTNKTIFVDIYNNFVFAYRALLAIYVLLALISGLFSFLHVVFFGIGFPSEESGFLLLSDLMSEFLDIFLYANNSFLIVLYGGLIGGWVYSRLASTLLVFISINRDSKSKSKPNTFPRFYQYNPDKLSKIESSTTNKIIKLLTYPVLFVFIISSIIIPLASIVPNFNFNTNLISNILLSYFFVIFLSMFVILYFDRSFILIKLSPSNDSIQFPSFKDPKVGVKSPLSYSSVNNAHCPQCNKILTTKFIENCPFCKTNLKGKICPFCLLSISSKSNTSSCSSCENIFHKEEFKTHVSIYKKCPICSAKILNLN